jgi:hypothetical protein
LKQYATIKKEVSKGIFRRPDAKYLIKDEEPGKKPIQSSKPATQEEHKKP